VVEPSRDEDDAPIGMLRDPPPRRVASLKLAAEAGSGDSTYQGYDDRITLAAESWLTERAKAKAEDKTDRAGDKAESKMDKVKDKARDAKDTVKDKLHHAKDKMDAKMDRAEVKNAQQALKDKGFDPGPIDGVWGPRTTAAARNFQKAENITVSGRLGVIAGQYLFYAKGGYASSLVEINVGNALGTTAHASQRLSGWLVGGGLESRVVSNIIFGIEYNYINLSGDRFTGVTAGTVPGAPFNVETVCASWNSDMLMVIMFCSPP